MESIEYALDNILTPARISSASCRLILDIAKPTKAPTHCGSSCNARSNAALLMRYNLI